jgi:hypothetical protein
MRYLGLDAPLIRVQNRSGPQHTESGDDGGGGFKLSQVVLIDHACLVIVGGNWASGYQTPTRDRDHLSSR